MLKPIRAIIIKYLEDKDKLIRKFIGEPQDDGDIFLTEEDKIEIREWDISDCIAVFERFVPLEDGRSCPWCILYRKKCDKCGYGIRHGVCKNHIDSTYDRILNKLKYINDQRSEKEKKKDILGRQCIIDIPDMRKLTYKFRDVSNRILLVINSLYVDEHNYYIKGEI